MSVDLTKVFFEGFLQKRKDTLKIWWVTYWFRLQNATLFFYTDKNGGASHLRSYYYIYTVQSVREVHRADKKRFLFEIIMTNGKRKVLAAETAALRKEWVGHLWQAMKLSASWVSRDKPLDVAEQQDGSNCNIPVSSDEQQDRLTSRVPNSSDTDSGGELLPTKRISAPSPSLPIDPEDRSSNSPVCQPKQPDCVEGNYQNTACNQQNPSDDGLADTRWPSGVNNTEDTQEGHYDVLPLRNEICVLNTSTEAEPIYDCPVSYRNWPACQDFTESIYDVPSSLQRKRPTNDEQREEDERFRRW